MNVRVKHIGTINLARKFPHNSRSFDLMNHEIEGLDKTNALAITEAAIESRSIHNDKYADLLTIFILSFIVLIAVLFLCWYRYICGKIVQICKRCVKCQSLGKETSTKSGNLEVNGSSEVTKEKFLHNVRSLSKDIAIRGTKTDRYCDKTKYCKLEAFLQERKRLLASDCKQKNTVADYKSNEELKERLSLNLYPLLKNRSAASLPCRLDELEEGRSDGTENDQNAARTKRSITHLITAFQREYSAYINSTSKREPINTNISNDPLTHNVLVHSSYHYPDPIFHSGKATYSQLTDRANRKMIYSCHNMQLIKPIETIRTIKSRVSKSHSCTDIFKNQSGKVCKEQEVCKSIGKRSTLFLDQKRDKTNRKDIRKSFVQDDVKLYGYNARQNFDAQLDKKCQEMNLPFTIEHSMSTGSTCNHPAESNSDATENYDELGMFFSHYMKLQASPCRRRYCSLARHLKLRDKHDTKHCQMKFKHYHMYPYDQRPACSSGNICEDTYDEFKLMKASISERQCLYAKMFRRRRQFLRQSCLSSRGIALFISCQ